MDDIAIDEAPAASDEVRWCFGRYYEELGRRFGYVVDEALPLDADDLTPPRGLVLIVRRAGRPVGCGALKLDQPGIGEIKRMWVAEPLRGQGLGSRLLGALEAKALAAGKRVTRLDTNRTLTAAVALYRRHGYRDVAPFNDEPFADRWFEKELPGRAEMRRSR